MWFTVVLDAVWPPLTGLSYALIRSRYGGDFRGRVYVMWGFAAAWEVVVDLTFAQWLPMACSATSLALAAWLYWRHRRRDRAPRSYGYKARARIAALIAKAREALRLRPVLRPVPGGAR